MRKILNIFGYSFTYIGMDFLNKTGLHLHLFQHQYEQNCLNKTPYIFDNKFESWHGSWCSQKSKKLQTWSRDRLQSFHIYTFQKFIINFTFSTRLIIVPNISTLWLEPYGSSIKNIKLLLRGIFISKSSPLSFWPKHGIIKHEANNKTKEKFEFK